MAILDAIQPSFAAGELSPYMYGRVDVAKFHVGCKQLQNFFVHSQGGASNRPGTRFIGEVDDSTKRHRLIPFQFRTLPSGQTYALVFGDYTMQVVMFNGTSWGFVQSGGGNYTLATPYAYADLPLLKFVQSADTMTITHPSYAPYQLTRTGHAAWAFTKMSFVPNTSAPTGLTATAGGTASYIQVTAINDSTGEESLPTAGVGSSSGTAGTWNWTAVTGCSNYNVYKQTGSVYGFVAQVQTTTWTDNNIGPDVGNTPPGSRNPFQTAITGATNANPGVITSNSHNYTSGQKVTFSGVGGMTQLNGNTYTITVIDANTYSIGVDTTGFSSYTSGGYTQGVGDWPGCTTYYQQRQVYGDTTKLPQTLWMSATGAFTNMNASTPTKDSDAITRTLVGQQVNEIRHVVPVGTSMLIMTSGAEWRCWPGPNSSALTPAACFTLPQTAHGSSHMPPVYTENTVIFAQEKGSTVRGLTYDALQDIYTSKDLSVLASHLFVDVTGTYTLQERAFADVPYKVVWYVRSDGILLGLTYMREHDVTAWHRHTTNGLFESVCSITEPDGYGGYEDAVYFIVNRTINGVTKRYVERMVSRTWGSSFANTWFLDCALQYNGWNTGANTLKIYDPLGTYLVNASVTLTGVGFTPSAGTYYQVKGADGQSVIVLASGSTTGTIYGPTVAPTSCQNIAVTTWATMATSVSGLSHLNGQTVGILGDGSVVPSKTVSAGAVALDGPYAIVTVGLPYTAQLETLNLELPAGGTMQGQMKKIAQVTIRAKDTRGASVGIYQTMSYGTTGTATSEVKQRTPQMTLGSAMTPYTGDWQINVPTEWNREGRIFVQQVYPLPVTILDLIPEVSVGD
jgi:Ubiquitin-activating enzyme E1 FCCH domain